MKLGRRFDFVAAPPLPESFFRPLAGRGVASMGTIGYLLDTHTFLWAVCESHKLGVDGKQVIANSKEQVYVSAISAYEITSTFL